MALCCNCGCRQDEEFQEDVRDPHVVDAFDYIQKPGADPER
jgi:hypothetical protein